MIKSFTEQYADFYDALKLYSKSYGGFWQIFASPYFLLAIIFTGLSFNVWLFQSDWEKIIITSAPPLIAFSLGAIAIFNSIGDSKFRDALLSAEGDEISPYVEINSMFVHFIFIQTIAFLLALTSQGVPPSLNTMLTEKLFHGGKFIGFLKGVAFLIFSYGAMQILATALAILRLSNSISRIHNLNLEAEEDTSQNPSIAVSPPVTIEEHIYIDKIIYKSDK